ncbi:MULTISPECIES: sugar ABC transporter substrate-binding protein [Haloferax]|uniref:Substrate-binding domain-containing protein n=2 Tax=Haloferax TaxID=2251 RepID=A0A6G1Z5Z1_9EURY|nr:MULTISPECIES: sugar ABC transporter substrate-binding protein [Haloferax]KAB1185333.1 sugar ABC transporter substrate-binding protein [Haloferax sp. CBA1149]MRW81970.1 substrate-binding domain-containing protein [Haloferax marinisediminis]
MTSRRKLLKGIGAAGIAGLAGCAGSQNNNQAEDSGSSGDSGTTTGDSSSSDSDKMRIAVSMKSMGQAGLYVQGQAAKWYTQDRDDVEIVILDAGFDASKQTQDAINAINQGLDGILLNPFDAKASRKIVEEASKNDIPVMNFDTATLSKDILAGALFGQYAGGKVAGERFTNMIEEKGIENPKVITSVFNFESTTSQARLYGFTENIPDSVEVVNRIESDGTPEDSAPQTQSALQANPDVDAIYSNNVGSGMGALTALKQMDMYHKRDHEDHVMAFGIDGGPELNQRIGSGYYDFAVDQPLHMYAPLTLELMWDYLENGDSAIPDVGTTLKPGEDISIKNKTVEGIKPWSEQFWGPATVTEYEAEDETWWRWIKCQHATITQENADAPYLYGNVYREIEGTD